MFLFLNTVRPYSFSELFEIKQGPMLPSKKNNKGVKDTGYLYKSIFISDLPASHESLDPDLLAMFSSIKELKNSHLLKKEDYLISSKGQIKGYALYRSNVFSDVKGKKYLGLVASNHFLILRPRASTLEAFGNSYFIYNLLDLLIPKFNALAKQGQNKSRIQYLTVSDLQNFSIQLPEIGILKELLQEFTQLHEEYESRIKALNQSKMNLEKYNQRLETIISPSL
jgi:restriction endonuclease S subunit